MVKLYNKGWKNQLVVLLKLKKEEAYKQYRAIGKVFCPYLDGYVVFNSKGFWHVLYKSRNKSRRRQVQ